MYKLRRSWGVPVALYRVTNSPVDRKTGQITLVTNKVEYRRGVLSPTDERYFKNVQLGDKSLLLGAILEPLGREDYFVIEGTRYSMINYQQLDDNTYFHLRQIQNQMKHETLDVSVHDGISMEEQL
jgi:hypothetical protein